MKAQLLKKNIFRLACNISGMILEFKVDNDQASDWVRFINE